MKQAQLHQRAWFCALLALSLVLSQALWLLHRVAHSGLTHSVAHTVHTVHVAASHVDNHAAHEPSKWLKALLPEHTDALSCAHFDQLSHADGLLGCAAPPGLTHAHAHAQPATHVASSLAAQAAGFLARGPPTNA